MALTLTEWLIFGGINLVGALLFAATACFAAR